MNDTSDQELEAKMKRLYKENPPLKADLDAQLEEILLTSVNKAIYPHSINTYEPALFEDAKQGLTKLIRLQRQEAIKSYKKVSKLEDEIPARQRIVNCFNGDDHVPVKAIDNLETLIADREREARIDEVQNTVCKDNTFGYQEGDWEGISKQKRLKQLRGELERKKEEL